MHGGEKGGRGEMKTNPRDVLIVETIPFAIFEIFYVHVIMSSGRATRVYHYRKQFVNVGSRRFGNCVASIFFIFVLLSHVDTFIVILFRQRERERKIRNDCTKSN